jgi:hypothetical protein
MSQKNLTESQKKLYNKLLKLSKITKTRPKKIHNNNSYQFISSYIVKEKKKLEKHDD